MRVFSLLLCFTMFATLASAQKKVEKKKEIIIIKTEDGKEMKAEVIDDMKKVEGAEDVEKVIKKMMKGFGDTTNVEVDVDVRVEDGVTIRKYKIKSTVDGKEEVREIVEEVEEGDEDVNTFTFEFEQEEEMASPKVSLGVMLVNSMEIDEIVEGSTAAKAGLMKGDRIKKLDQQIIYNYRGLIDHMNSYNVGDKAVVTTIGVCVSMAIVKAPL